MTTQASGWASAFKAFLDRRALIMLFLGFSAGIPILLIFSSLSLWLGEAGIDKSAVTFFSWAALGYSFKFVWAPLIDELPVPFLTKSLGRRRAWLLIAQCLIICAICIMAFSDPALGKSYLIQMAAGAVLLGFSAATQDIVIDAYRIELAETEMQTVLASTYNAGYRIGMIVAGAGALFLAAYLGTAKGNYIYEAWKYTYLTMAAVMVVGIITTLCVREPQVNRVYKQYKTTDYYRLVFVFFIAVVTFVLSYIYSGNVTDAIAKSAAIKDTATLFGLEALRFLTATAIALLAGFGLVKMGVVNQQMAKETWVAPILDFFKRYGVKLALVLLLLIGFFRISDIIAGVISNVFYQDLNFSKEQIAEAVKIYGVLFSLVGGFLGGLLAQRMNIMKLMFVGAVLASSTNLIFIGLVKSGKPLDQVEVQVGDQHYQVQPDEVGYWKLQVPNEVLLKANQVQVSTQYQNQAASHIQLEVPYLIHTQQPEIQILPINNDDQLTLKELKQSLVIKGQLAGVKAEELDAERPVILKLDGQEFTAKIDQKGLFTGAVDGKLLQASPTKTLQAVANLKVPAGHEVLATRQYRINPAAHADVLDIDIQPVAVIDPGQSGTVELSGKVIKSYSSLWLYLAIIIDNLASGLAGAAFIAFLSSLTSVSFTAVQYAIFSSLMTLTPKLLGGYSGTIVSNIGYPNFFLMTTLIGIPILFLVVWVAKLLRDHENRTTQQTGE
ncbi:AmpG family muropeptide MFS transporter [Acinetobacter colistiniresistens]|uniref:AmpG family muropeptide MFS transporter n=1 Tax=Acinetobacter colistiniresistens TaxID=280145 RepID=S3TS15_9GAMM|nr:MFS transporter [Acinetobacter colistiniresistens]EPG38470.1 MFS transporter, PAT family, beta-lactamase induction signal transducer AmpG [Acinetobacter colistiniresistens]TVT80095.1 AmpG family muropeptide MFS transporter [Acinetobacter colistiniresistens]